MRRPNVIAVAVDVIIEWEGSSVVLIERRNAPHGWALPGGFVEYGETLEAAAIREAAEETSLTVELVRQFHTYSAPRRDPRGHTIATVFIARGRGTPRAQEDAQRIGTFRRDALPSPLAFDHGQILEDYFGGRY
jgi:8-oxo-dGTP diphosphatase